MVIFTLGTSGAVRCSAAMFSLPILLLLGACQSLKPVNSDGATPSMAVILSAEVPLPATTPFDSLPGARAAYLEAYCDGYHSGLTSLNMLIRKPDLKDQVRSQGWRAGVDAGFNQHSAEVINKPRP